jgi:tetratricopeptide (TPR) repeat protein
VYVPDRRGSLQAEMVAAARRYGRLPYVIEPGFPALLAELESGRPVLVLQNLGVAWRPAWHYAVAVGFSPGPGDIVLRSGTDRRRVTDAGVFANTWKRSGNWGVVLLRPGELPADAEPGRFLSAAAAAESAGHLQLAADAYGAAFDRWPDSALAMLGLGNTAYRRGDLAEAEQWYRRALAVEPGDVLTLNNLAAVVAGQGRCAEGGLLIRRARELAGSGSATAALLSETESEISTCR